VCYINHFRPDDTCTCSALARETVHARVNSVTATLGSCVTSLRTSLVRNTSSRAGVDTDTSPIIITRLAPSQALLRPFPGVPVYRFHRSTLLRQCSILLCPGFNSKRSRTCFTAPFCCVRILEQ